VSYTALAVLGVIAAVVLDLAVLRTRLLTRRVFWTAYAIIVVFQLLTNGWLTGRDIVTYDDDTITGARIAYAPVEDLLFGFSLVLQTLAWWVWWGRRLSGSLNDAVGDARDGPAPGRGQPPAAGSPPAP
jgi:lycopene cyclase domain-containing protein